MNPVNKKILKHWARSVHCIWESLTVWMLTSSQIMEPAVFLKKLMNRTLSKSDLDGFYENKRSSRAENSIQVITKHHIMMIFISTFVIIKTYFAVDVQSGHKYPSRVLLTTSREKVTTQTAACVVWVLLQPLMGTAYPSWDQNNSDVRDLCCTVLCRYKFPDIWIHSRIKVKTWWVAEYSWQIWWLLPGRKIV